MQRALALGLGIAFILLLGALATSAYLRVELPAPTGEHDVGRTRLSYLTARPEELTAASDDTRELALVVYYPTLARGPPSPYLAGALADALRGDAGPMGILPDAWDRIGTSVRDDAPVLEGIHPLLVFSPGLDVQPEYYSSLLADLASHGYLVASIAHPYSTPVAGHADGRLVHATPEGAMERVAGFEAREAARQRIGAIWTADVRDAVDAMLADARLGGHVDPARIGAFGHSFGGAAAVEAARVDERIRAASDLDGTLFGGAQEQGLRKPVLLVEEPPMSDADLARFGMTRERYLLSPDVVGRDRLMANGTPSYRLVLSGATHQTFVTDPTIFAARFGFIDGHGEIDGHLAVEILREYHLAFFSRHLGLGAGSTLDGPHRDEVTLLKGGPEGFTS